MLVQKIVRASTIMCAPGITYTYKKSNTAPGTRYTRRAFKPLFLIGSIHIEGTPRFGRKAGAASRDTPTLNIATALCYYVLSIYFGRESSIWCGGDPFHLDRHHKDMPGTTHHTYHTRYDRGEPAAGQHHQTHILTAGCFSFRSCATPLATSGRGTLYI